VLVFDGDKPAHFIEPFGIVYPAVDIQTSRRS